jgi:hypothetical protein
MIEVLEDKCKTLVFTTSQGLLGSNPLHIVRGYRSPVLYLDFSSCVPMSNLNVVLSVN